MADIEVTLETLGCDPLQLSAKLAMGRPINKSHKDLSKIKSKWDNLIKGIQRGQVSKTQIDDLWILIHGALSKTKPSSEIQSKHIISLTEYLHSKKKSIENINKVKRYSDMSEMSDEVLERIAKGEDVNVVIGEDDDTIASN